MWHHIYFKLVAVLELSFVHVDVPALGPGPHTAALAWRVVSVLHTERRSHTPDVNLCGAGLHARSPLHGHVGGDRGDRFLSCRLLWRWLDIGRARRQLRGYLGGGRSGCRRGYRRRWRGRRQRLSLLLWIRRRRRRGHRLGRHWRRPWFGSGAVVRGRTEELIADPECARQQQRLPHSPPSRHATLSPQHEPNTTTARGRARVF